MPVRETEADATAFVVLHGLGIDYNARAYIAWQQGSGARIRRSMKRIAAAAQAIRLAIEGEMPDVCSPEVDLGVVLEFGPVRIDIGAR